MYYVQYYVLVRCELTTMYLVQVHRTLYLVRERVHIIYITSIIIYYMYRTSYICTLYNRTRYKVPCMCSLHNIIYSNPTSMMYDVHSTTYEYKVRDVHSTSYSYYVHVHVHVHRNAVQMAEVLR